MTKPITITNQFHNTRTSIRPRPDGTISAATYRRARRELCPSPSCRCFSSPASGPEVLIIIQAEPVYDGAAVVAYRLCMEPEDR